MKCPICLFSSGLVHPPPLDRYNNPIFLWDQVYLSDTGNDDTEGYVVEILSSTKIRVLLVKVPCYNTITVWDMKAIFVTKADSVIDYIA